MKIVIMHQTVAKHDAIGNDIEGMYKLLSKENECFVYAENQFNNVVTYIDTWHLFDVISRQDCVVIYHHSVYWAEGYAILKHVQGKIIFRYHNITPQKYFKGYNEWHYNQCVKGRLQTETFIREFKNAVWIADSVFNTEDLHGGEVTQVTVCPPFHKIEQWDKEVPDEEVLKQLLYSETINLLFVGRVVPNKGYRMLLEIVSAFKATYTQKIKLNIIGKFDDSLAQYNKEIHSYIQQNNLEEDIKFVGEINDSILMAYYLGSAMLICTSEHEGFCVPIIEAQHFGLPVLALNECAVPETLGKNQILLDKDVKKFVAAIPTIAFNEKYQVFLSEQGKRNYEKRFTSQIIAQRFMDVFMEGIGK